MPMREEVRSLIFPNSGLPNMATSAPMPVTRASLVGACAVPTSEFTFNARLTSNGANSTRHVLMYANVYSVMKPQPTRLLGSAGTGGGAVGVPRAGTSGIARTSLGAPSLTRPVRRTP